MKSARKKIFLFKNTQQTCPCVRRLIMKKDLVQKNELIILF